MAMECAGALARLTFDGHDSPGGRKNMTTDTTPACPCCGTSMLPARSLPTGHFVSACQCDDDGDGDPSLSACDPDRERFCAD